MNRCNHAFSLVGNLFLTSSVNERNLEKQKILNCVRVLEINNEFSKGNFLMGDKLENDR
jgi:hypothetical protein